MRSNLFGITHNKLPVPPQNEPEGRPPVLNHSSIVGNAVVDWDLGVGMDDGGGRLTLGEKPTMVLS